MDRRRDLTLRQVNAACGIVLVAALIFLQGTDAWTVQVSSSQIQATLSPAVAICGILLASVFLANLISQPAMELADDVPGYRLFLSFAFDLILIVWVYALAGCVLLLADEYLRTGNFAWSIDRPSIQGNDLGLRIGLFLLFLGAWSVFGLHIYFAKQTLGGALTKTFIRTEDSASVFRCLLFGPIVCFEIGTLILPEHMSRRLEVAVFRVRS